MYTEMVHTPSVCSYDQFIDSKILARQCTVVIESTVGFIMHRRNVDILWNGRRLAESDAYQPCPRMGLRARLGLHSLAVSSVLLTLRQRVWLKLCDYTSRLCYRQIYKKMIVLIGAPQSWTLKNGCPASDRNGKIGPLVWWYDGIGGWRHIIK